MDVCALSGRLQLVMKFVLVEGVEVEGALPKHFPFSLLREMWKSWRWTREAPQRQFRRTLGRRGRYDKSLQLRLLMFSSGRCGRTVVGTFVGQIRNARRQQREERESPEPEHMDQ